MACKSKALDSDSKMVLKVLSESEEPLGSKDIAEKTGLDSKTVSSKITSMKKLGLVESPARCKYSATDQGKNTV